MPEKIYLKSSAKEIDTQYGSMLAISFKAEDMIAFCKEHANDKGYMNLNVNRRKEVGQYGDTHSVTLNTWKPGEQSQQRQQPKRDERDDIP